MSEQDHKLINHIADILCQAEADKITCDPIRNLLDDLDVNLAYRIQEEITSRRIKSGNHIIGRKIGLTSEAVQAQLGVDQPDFGVLFDDMLIENGGEISMSLLMQPKAEAEIAFTLKDDLNGDNISMEEVITSIDHARVSIEIAGSRVKDWDISIVDTIADNASANHFVLGSMEVKLKEMDLVNCWMEMYKNGTLISSGTSSDCMGSPLISLQWLAQKLSDFGTPLSSGDIVMSGALGPMTDIIAGDHIIAKIEGLGEVEVYVV